MRVLAGSLGATQRFSGPMAKPHRMAVLTAACLLSLIEVATGFEGPRSPRLDGWSEAAPWAG